MKIEEQWEHEENPVQDGTAIAVDRIGRGPALVFVDGAMCYRASGPSQQIAAALAEHFTVFTTIGGGGDSGDTPPYDVYREIDYLDAVIAKPAVRRCGSARRRARRWPSRPPTAVSR